MVMHGLQNVARQDFIATIKQDQFPLLGGKGGYDVDGYILQRMT